MAKSDKELAVELTCAYLQEFATLASTPRAQGNPHSKEQIVEMVRFFAEELAKIKDN